MWRALTPFIISSLDSSVIQASFLTYKQMHGLAPAYTSELLIADIGPYSNALACAIAFVLLVLYC